MCPTLPFSRSKTYKKTIFPSWGLSINNVTWFFWKLPPLCHHFLLQCCEPPFRYDVTNFTLLPLYHCCSVAYRDEFQTLNKFFVFGKICVYVARALSKVCRSAKKCEKLTLNCAAKCFCMTKSSTGCTQAWPFCRKCDITVSFTPTPPLRALHHILSQ